MSAYHQILDQTALSERPSDYLFAPVELPSQEQMKVKLVPLSLADRLEEARADGRIWSAVAWTLIGTVLGALGDWFLLDLQQIPHSSIAFVVLIFGLAVLMVCAAWRYGRRAKSINTKMRSAGVVLPLAEGSTESTDQTEVTPIQSPVTGDE